MFVVVFRFVFAVVVVTGVVVVFVLITFVVFPHTVNVIAIMFAFLVLHQWFCGSIVAASWLASISPSEGSLLYEYVEEVGKPKESRNRYTIKDGHSSTCRPSFGSSDRQTTFVEGFFSC